MHGAWGKDFNGVENRRETLANAEKREIPAEPTNDCKQIGMGAGEPK